MSNKKPIFTETKVYVITRNRVGSGKGEINTKLRKKLLAFDHTGNHPDQMETENEKRLKKEALTTLLPNNINQKNKLFRCQRPGFIPFNLQTGALTPLAKKDGITSVSADTPIFLVTSEVSGLITALAVLTEHRLRGATRGTPAGKGLKLEYLCGAKGVTNQSRPELQFRGTATRILKQIKHDELPELSRKYLVMTLLNNSEHEGLTRPGYYSHFGFKKNTTKNGYMYSKIGPSPPPGPLQKPKRKRNQTISPLTSKRSTRSLTSPLKSPLRSPQSLKPLKRPKK